MDTSVSTTSTPRNSPKRRRFSSKRGSLNPRQRREVMNLVHRNQELKFIAINQAATAITTTAFVSGVAYDVSQGATDSQRIGDSLMWAGSIDLKVQVVNGQGATADIYNNVRLVIFQWHPNSTPTAGSIFLNGPSAVVDVYSQYIHDNRQEFIILFDKTWRTTGNANAATTPNTSVLTTGVLTYRIPLTKATKKVQFQAGGATATNRFYVLQISDSALATHPTLAFSSKAVFRDG